jgi:multiple sugar transport system permease protein
LSAALASRGARAAAVALSIGFFALPIAYLLSLSFKTKDDVLTGSFLPHGPTLANWPAAFAAAPLATFIGNSVVVAVLSGLLTVAITFPAVYAVERLAIARKWLPQAVLSSYMAPPVVALVPLFFLFRVAGLINSHVGLILLYGVLNVPVAFWLLAPFVRRVPAEIEEAAALDGASRFRTLVSVVLPMTAPGVAATTIIAVVLAYGEFLFASTFAFSDATRTLTVGVSLFQGDRLINFGQMAVASLSGIAPVYLLALLSQRWLLRGLTEGSIK